MLLGQPKSSTLPFNSQVKKKINKDALDSGKSKMKSISINCRYFMYQNLNIQENIDNLVIKRQI